ncbi:hypothetical protein [Bacillus sp. ISL-55]|uniref:hypothetical protein n=1 Tax=Bacillus sp. ISL-55 TaxID=2819134 RepID=UPI001BE87437|nr:hypothetical protein [Bacillus sp. ISL-55]MBT2694489.1 hypothetical protein [Bacillus sp. ISL-55]
MGERAINMSERAIIAYIGAIILHHSANIKDDRAIIEWNEQNNFSSLFFSFDFQQYATPIGIYPYLVELVKKHGSVRASTHHQQLLIFLFFNRNTPYR